MLNDIHPDRALDLVVEAGRRLHPEPAFESVPLSEALGRLLCRPLVSTIDHPPFDKSAMDGYAYSAIAPEGIYRVVDAVAAGRGAARSPGRGEAVKIMTGAPLPPGAIGVQRIERTKAGGQDGSGLPLVVFTETEKHSNIIRKGENLGSGELLLSPRVLGPQDIGILASSGFAQVEVAARLMVGVVSTGDELVPQGRALTGAFIYDSNGPQLIAQAMAAGASTRFYGQVPDRGEKLEEVLGRALGECDIVLVSGGVSMGDFDFVPSILGKLGVEPVFHHLAMKPGKPTFFGVSGKAAVFGLPGNPVSTFVNFEVLVKPCAFAMMGMDYLPPTVAAVLGSALARRETDRVEFLPARLAVTDRGLEALPLAYHGSSMITVLADADVLLRMEIGQERLEKGAIVHARRLRP
jgi:molybdopterin molybdotransferase